HFAISFFVKMPEYIAEYFGLCAGQSEFQGIQFRRISLLYTGGSDLHDLFITQFAVNNVVDFAFDLPVPVLCSHNSRSFWFFYLKMLTLADPVNLNIQFLPCFTLYS